MTNVLVLPGAGTLAAGRRLAGFVQAILAIVGFVMVCVWMVSWVSEMVKQADIPTGLGPHAGLGLFGLLLAVVAWVWGFVSGLAILREARERVRPGGR
jgi:uncharacterized membrane protein